MVWERGRSALLYLVLYAWRAASLVRYAVKRLPLAFTTAACLRVATAAYTCPPSCRLLYWAYQLLVDAGFAWTYAGALLTLTLVATYPFVSAACAARCARFGEHYRTVTTAQQQAFPVTVHAVTCLQFWLTLRWFPAVMP